MATTRARLSWGLMGLVLTAAWGATAQPAACDHLPGSLLPPPGHALAEAVDAGLDLALADILPGPAATEQAIPGTHGCEGKIRPGARLSMGNGFFCTASWVLEDAQGALYLATAGHCVEPNCESSTPSLDIRVRGLDMDIGDPAFSTGGCGPGNDFALIRLDPAAHAHVDPTVCRWGGPQGLGGPEDGDLRQQAVLYYGWGTLYGADPALRARAGLLPSAGWGDASLIYAGATNGGDSGMPLMSREGKAVGVHTHTSLLLNVPVAGAGQKFATRLDVAMGWAGAALGTPLHLVDSPVPVDLTGLRVPG